MLELRDHVVYAQPTDYVALLFLPRRSYSSLHLSVCVFVRITLKIFK